MRRIPSWLIERIEELARLKAQIPTAKELARENDCSIRQVQYHFRKALLRVRREKTRALRQTEIIEQE